MAAPSPALFGICSGCRTLAGPAVTTLAAQLRDCPDQPNWGDARSTEAQRLSVAELQLALLAARQERQRHQPSRPAAPTPTVCGAPVPALRAVPEEHASPIVGDGVTVIAAHPGAGASTVALALATGAAASGRMVHLVEWCAPSRSGLAAATTSELGLMAGGRWRRGRRGDLIVVDRRADVTLTDSPTLPEIACLRIADAGTIDAEVHTAAVLVCRATVPGLRHAEQALASQHGPVALAVIGPARWPGSVTASAGPTVRRLRAEGRVVLVPWDGHLAVDGLSAAPLPKRIVAAAARLLALFTLAPGDEAPVFRASPRLAEKGSTR